MIKHIKKSSIIMISFGSLLLSACSQMPPPDESMQSMTPDQYFCYSQGGEFIDGAYPTCVLPNGLEIHANDFYQY